MDKSLLKLSATSLIQLLKNKEISSLELTKAFLERIYAVNPALNAVVQVNEEASLKSAREQDAKLKRGDKIGLMHGLPITIKDTIDIFGYKNTYGSHLYDNYKPTSEGTSVNRLRSAGSVVLGLTNSPELLTAYEADNLIYGATNNPYDLSLSSGGSSGGEASVIAAYGSPFGLGTDGGGSIRIPAHYCGISGIKPTQGLVPLTGIALPLVGAGALQPFGTCGPMARYVDDLTLGLSVLSGPDGSDPGAHPVQFGDPSTVDIAKLKVAYFTDNGIVKPSQDVIDTTLEAVKALANLGMPVAETRPSGIENTFELHWETFFTMADGGKTVSGFLNGLTAEQVSPLRKQFNLDAKQCNLSTSQMNKRFAEIAQFRRETYQFLNEYDIIICPPCATAAKKHGECLNAVRDFTYAMTFNNTGSAAVVIPFGVSNSGLPLGVQIVANMWKDHVALAVAKYLESYYKNNIARKFKAQQNVEVAELV